LPNKTAYGAGLKERGDLGVKGVPDEDLQRTALPRVDAQASLNIACYTEDVKTIQI
jgi:hypothetical protein